MKLGLAHSARSLPQSWLDAADDRIGDDAIVSAALPPASATARKETRVGGHGLLLYA